MDALLKEVYLSVKRHIDQIVPTMHAEISAAEAVLKARRSGVEE